MKVKDSRSKTGFRCKHDYEVFYGPTEENGWAGNPYQWVRCSDCGKECVEQPPKFRRQQSKGVKEGV